MALYDYTAADDDEVSFMEGDLVSDVTVIDDGWMEGRVERTGEYGMLPSNYVESIWWRDAALFCLWARLLVAFVRKII